MRSEVHDRPEGYRTASKPDAMPVTVTTVRHNEYAEPLWLTRLRDRLGRWLGIRAGELSELRWP